MVGSRYSGLLMTLEVLIHFIIFSGRGWVALHVDGIVGESRDEYDRSKAFRLKNCCSYGRNRTRYLNQLGIMCTANFRMKSAKTENLRATPSKTCDLARSLLERVERMQRKSTVGNLPQVQPPLAFPSRTTRQ